MPRGEKLNQDEKNKIDELRKKKILIRKIALEIERSKTVAQNYLQLGNMYKVKDRHERKKMTDKRIERRIFRAVKA